MKIAPEGYPVIIFEVILLLLNAILFIYFQNWIIDSILIFLVLFFLFTLFFFRDPVRDFSVDNQTILSPADGTIIDISEEIEDNYINNKALKISIFMSVFNVHVNRIPFTGEVEYLRYHTGKFHIASLPKASLLNEQHHTGLKTKYGKVFFKQIAGTIARRVINHLQLNQKVITGERMGCIRFGSRVDIFLPPETKLAVKKGDKVRGGLTILGKFL